MPFFSGRFRSPLSKSNQNIAKERSEDQSTSIKLNLNGYKTEFSDGTWSSETNISGDSALMEDLKLTILRLQEENNLLKLKNEILLQMLMDESLSN